jgi:light-harvesting complex 1 beta chain
MFCREHLDHGNPAARDTRRLQVPISEGINMAASLSGLTEEQAQEFQAQFKIGFQTWLAIAIVAHVLVFAWRPWF